MKIEREFTNWLKECHERYDKQVCVCECEAKYEKYAKKKQM